MVTDDDTSSSPMTTADLIDIDPSLGMLTEYLRSMSMVAPAPANSGPAAADSGPAAADSGPAAADSDPAAVDSGPAAVDSGPAPAAKVAPAPAAKVAPAPAAKVAPAPAAKVGPAPKAAAPVDDAGVPDLPDLELMQNSSLDSRLLSTEANVGLVANFELRLKN